jgi:hypothetical protein
MFDVGDRVRLANAFGKAVDGFGTVIGRVTPHYVKDGADGVHDDVLVRWDTGLEIALAPHSLMPAGGG